MPIPAAAGSLAGPLIGAGANILGGLFGMSGQSSANQANLQIARENRRFQERMSSTAYQRATKDLEAAGLNRILALGSPSSSPAGNIATMQNVKKPLQEGIGTGVSTALQARLLTQQLKNMETERLFKKAQTDVITIPAKIGGGGGTIIDKAKEGYTKSNIPAIIGTLTTKAENKIAQIAESLGLNVDKAKQQLLKTLNEMDLPPTLKTDEQKLQWAIDHQQQIERYLKRQKQQGF